MTHHPPATRSLHPPRACPECGQPVPPGMVRHRPCMMQHEKDRLAAQDERDRQHSPIRRPQ